MNTTNHFSKQPQHSKKLHEHTSSPLKLPFPSEDAIKLWQQRCQGYELTDAYIPLGPVSESPLSQAAQEGKQGQPYINSV